MPNTSFLLGAALSALVAIAVQDPVKPAPTPPAAATAKAPQEVPGRPRRHPFEGVYALHQRIVDGNPDPESHGYLAITNRYMFLCVAGAGPDPDLPLLRAAVHEWKPERDQIRRVVQLSYYTDAGGGIHADPVGTTELRSVRLLQGGLRITMDDKNWLDFTRLE